MSELDRLKEQLRDREKELYRVRTTETAAAHELDAQQTPEQRANFQQTCNKLVEAELLIEDLKDRLEDILFYIEQRPELSDKTSADYGRQVYQTLKILGREPIGHCCACHSLIKQDAPHAKWDDGTLTHAECKKPNVETQTTKQ